MSMLFKVLKYIVSYNIPALYKVIWYFIKKSESR